MTNLQETTSVVILKEILQMTPDNFEVSVYGDGVIRHIHNVRESIFLSSEPKVGNCNKCSNPVVKSLTNDSEYNYSGYCFNCDNDLFDFEIEKIK